MPAENPCALFPRRRSSVLSATRKTNQARGTFGLIAKLNDEPRLGVLHHPSSFTRASLGRPGAETRRTPPANTHPRTYSSPRCSSDRTRDPIVVVDEPARVLLSSAHEAPRVPWRLLPGTRTMIRGLAGGRQWNVRRLHRAALSQALSQPSAPAAPKT